MDEKYIFTKQIRLNAIIITDNIRKCWTTTVWIKSK